MQTEDNTNPIDVFAPFNMSVAPAYLPEIIMSRRALAGVPDHRPINFADEFEWHQHAVPDGDNQAVVAGGKYEQVVSLPVGSYITGFAAYSQQAAGFAVSVRDDGTKTQFFSRSFFVVSSGAGQVVVTGKALTQTLLEQPRLVIEPALLTVQIENLDTSNANGIQFVMFTAEPRD